MTGRSLAWWGWLALAAVAFAGPVSVAFAQQFDAGPARVRAVDESRAADWPAGPWQAIPRRDYLDLLRDIARLRSRPRSAWIQAANYTGRIDGTRLRDGRLSLQLVNNAPGPATIPLAPLGLAIDSLEHDGQAPAWGTTAAGHVVLVAPPGRSTVTGRWSLHGREVATLVEFDVLLAPAVQTSLLLDLPDTHRLTTSVGQLTAATADAARAVPAGHRRLRLDLGRRAHCRLVIDRAPTAAPPAPTRLLVRQRSSCEIAVNGARIVTELVFERTGQATRELVLSMPADVRVESILYDGAIVDARPLASGPGQAWRITLPDPLPHALESPSRTLQVTIEADILPGRAWRLPEITVVGSQPISSQLKAAQPDLTLSVREPLELKTFRAVGWKQTADAVGGRRFTFSRIAATTSLELVIGQPQRSLTADVLARIDRGQTGWTVSAEIAWSAASGASFSTRALLAPGWNIVDLRPVDPAVRVEWRTVAVAGNRQQLIVEWSDAVDTNSTRPLLMQLSRAGNELDVSDLPLIEPLDCDRHRLVLAAAVPLAGTRLGDSTEGLLEPIRPESLGDPWPAFDSFDAVTESAAGGLFRWSPAPAANPNDRRGPDRPPRDPAAAPIETAAAAAPRETLVDQSSETSGSSDTGRAVWMQVLSRMAPVDADLDHHTARINFAGASFRRPFRFQLPRPAQLEAVLVNGQAAAAESDGPWVSIPPLEQGALRTIEIRYTTPAATGFLVSNHSTPFPQLETDVRFSWEVAAPPDQLIAAGPGRHVAAGPAPGGHWSARWLGPLGRGPHHALFNPLSPTNWRQLVDGSAAPRNPARHDTRHVSLAAAPAELAVSLVRHDRLAALSWLVLVLTLVVGVCCRVANRRPTARCTAGGLAVLVLLGWWVPAPWTLLTGAALAASWLLLLLPSSLWRRQSLSELSPRPHDFDEASLGSTQTFRGIPTGLGLLLACAGLSHAVAQDTPATTPESPRANRPDVLLPVDADGRPSTVVPFAFVRPKLLEALRAERRVGVTDTGVLLRQANYSGTIRPDGSIELTATIEAVVTGRDAAVRVELPLDGVNLGPDDCRVNGQRHPLARGDDGKTLLLELPPASSDTPRVDRIELDLRPTVTATPRGGSIELAIPRILAGRLELLLPPNPPRVAVPTAIAVDSKDGHYLLGAGRRLRIEWSSDPDAASARPRPTATVAPLGLVVVHPLESRLEYRLPVTVSDGELSFLTLALPRQLVFRPGDIAAPDVLTIRSLPPRAGRRLVVVEFATPQTGDFEIRLVGRLPLTADNGRLTIQSGITLSHGAPPIPIVAAPMRLGLSPSRGFQLAATVPAPEGATAIDVVEFTRDWLADQDTSQALATLAWSLDRPVGLPLEIQPLRPRRVVRVEQFLHVGQERMELTITATARTTGSSVFHHSLTIDPRLKITSISIQQQDGAERLARSARVGNQLVLYLKDANLSEEETQAGIQNITIQGELPLRVPQRVVLPELVFDDAETTSRTLSLYHAPQLSVTVIGAKPLTPSDDTTSAVDAREVLAGRFSLPDDSKPVELSIRRSSLPAAVQMVYRLQPDPAGSWRLQARAIPLPGPRPNGPLLVTVESTLLAVNGTENPIRWQPSPDSQSVKDGRLEAGFRNVAGVTLDAVLPEVPDADRWTPPLPAASGRQIRQSLLVLPEQISWVPDGDVTRLDAWPDTLPRDELDADGTATLWRLDGPNWSLSRNTRPAARIESSATKSPTAAPPPAGSARPIQRPAVAEGSTPAWWIAWQILLSTAFAALIAWGLPRAQRSRPKQWIRRHDPVAWLLIGLGWWLAGAAGALGFGLAAAMAAALLLLRARPGRQPEVPETTGSPAAN